MFKSTQMTAQQNVCKDKTLENEMAVKLEIIWCSSDLEEDQIGGSVFNLRLQWTEWQKADIYRSQCYVSKGVLGL